MAKHLTNVEGGGGVREQCMGASDGHKLNPSTRRQKQADLCEIRPSLVYMEFRSSQGYAERESDS